MCLHPISIDNPHFGLGDVGLAFLRDTTSSKISVPCGSCVQCVAMRQGFYIQRVQMESLRSDIFMFTLTYNNDSLVYVDIGEYYFPIPYLPDIQNMFHRLRHSYLSDKYNWRYAYVSEYGKDHFRPHFHGLVAVERCSGVHYSIVEHDFSTSFFKEWRRNIGSRRLPVYQSLFTPVRDHTQRITTFDFHFVEPVRDHDNDVSYYVSKYITKYDTRTQSLLKKIALDVNLHPVESSDLISLVRPISVMSKDFGSWKDAQIYDYISSCASRDSAFSFPQYYDIYTGKQMPMSPYYGKRLPSYARLYKRFSEFSLFSHDLSTIIPDFSTVLDYSISRDHSFLDEQNFEKNKLEIWNNQKL